MFHSSCTTGVSVRASFLALAYPIRLIPLPWPADFAVWCSYKYLNGGAGAVAGLFVHSSHTAGGFSGPLLAGWWGHNPATRFAMPPSFEPIEGAGAWQHSNPPMLSMLPLIATLESIETAGGLPALRARSIKLTSYLEALLKESRFYRPPGMKATGERELSFQILTPEREGERGAQLSLAVVEGNGETKGVMVRVFDGLQRRGVLGDERKPDVIRLSYVPGCRRTRPSIQGRDADAALEHSVQTDTAVHDVRGGAARGRAL
jgi:kynureninase